MKLLFVGDVVGSPGRQVLEAAVNGAKSLDDKALARLDEIFPGPGPAPQAYAW